MEFFNKKWLMVNEDVAHKKILSCTEKALVVDLGR
jgi:hypothetical protein